MKQKLQIITAFLCGAVFFSGISYAAEELKARTTNYSIEYNGEVMKLDDPVLSVNSKSHIPLRGVLESLGYDVGFENGVISLTDENYVPVEPVEEVKADGKGTNDLSAKYSVDGKLNGALLKAAIEAKEVDVNAQDSKTGESFFHVIIKENNYDAYKVISAKGINPNLKDKEGRTPFHIAVIEDNSFYFGELRSNFRVEQYKDNDGKYPIDYAENMSTYYRSLMFVDKAE